MAGTQDASEPGYLGRRRSCQFVGGSAGTNRISWCYRLEIHSNYNGAIEDGGCGGGGDVIFAKSERGKSEHVPKTVFFEIGKSEEEEAVEERGVAKRLA